MSRAAVAQLAERVRLEAERHPARSPQRRAASHLWAALTVPPAGSIEAARRAVATFGDELTRQAALALLDSIAAEAAQ